MTADDSFLCGYDLRYGAFNNHSSTFFVTGGDHETAKVGRDEIQDQDVYAD